MARKETTIPTKPTPEEMEVTPERALRIKLALIRQLEDQFHTQIDGWTETPKDSNQPPRTYKVTSRFPTYEAEQVS